MIYKNPFLGFVNGVEWCCLAHDSLAPGNRKILILDFSFFFQRSFCNCTTEFSESQVPFTQVTACPMLAWQCASTVMALWRARTEKCRRFNPKSPSNFRTEDNEAPPQHTRELGGSATPFLPAFCDHAPWLDVNPVAGLTCTCDQGHDGGINSKWRTVLEGEDVRDHFDVAAARLSYAACGCFSFWIRVTSNIWPPFPRSRAHHQPG